MSSASNSHPSPPVAARRPHTVSAPAGDRTDPYFWLRDDSRSDPEVLAYLEAENRYARAMLAPLQPTIDAIYGEIVDRIDEDESTPPVWRRGHWYYRRFEAGKEYPIWARRVGSLEAPEQILLDGNIRAEGLDYYSLARVEVSDDSRLAAFAEDTVGRRQYSLRIVDLETGEVLPDRVDNITGAMAWASDNRTVVYVARDPVTLRGYRVLAHTVGTDAADDRVLYEERDETFYTTLNRSKTGAFVFVMVWSTLTTEVLAARADDPALALAPVIPRTRGHEYSVDHRHDGQLVIVTNEEATNFRIVAAPVGRAADRSTWRELVPHSDEILISGVEVFRDFMAIAQRSDGLRKIRILGRDGGDRLLDAPEPAYVMQLQETPEYDSPTFRYTYQSPTTPPITYDYDVATGERIERKRKRILGDFDPSRYRCDYISAPARDGARIPVSIVYRADTPLDGTAPLLQYAYGSYGSSRDPSFSIGRLSLLDRGFVYALAHVRGGQERGRRWYEDGRQLAKKNSFTDFVDVTEHLVRERYGDPARIFAAGGSAGGLLVGAVVNMRPELYRGAIAWVPFVDVVTTMLDESIPLTTGEFDEWGDPKDETFYRYMLSYSPYDNVRAQAYPAMLVTTGLHDSQVQYWEPAKWVARLRATRTDDAPLLFITEMEAGHGGKSGRYESYREVARDYAFLIGLAGG